MARRPPYDVPGEALDKYEEFHRYPPKKVGEFHPSFQIPTAVYEAGDAKWVTYRSGKVDPSTLRKPRKAVDYIHEFSAGVTCYMAKKHNLPVSAGKHDDDKALSTPSSARDVEALVLLGKCLGFAFTDGEEHEAEARSPLPDLYCTPDGKVLLVIQGHKDVLAMFWGGALGVFARGIDG